MSLSSPDQRPIRVALEPVCNILNSFSLLTEVEQLSGLSPWVVQTAAALTPEQCQTNQLVFRGLRDVLTPLQDEPNFPSYLHNLAEVNPYLMRKMVLEPLRRRFSRLVSYATPSTDRLLDDVSSYLYCVECVQGERSFDPELHTQVHALFQNPPELQRLILSHLELLWKTTTIAAEWKRVQSSLRWQVEMFTHSLEEEATVEETFHALTGRAFPAELARQLTNVEEIVLVPSWHTGRHVMIWNGASWDGDDWGGKEIARVFFSEPPNYDVALLNAAPVGRGELRARLDALADETRLRIIELLMQQSEMHAQDIIAALELSQSSVSRHIKQLASMGYLYERRGEGANKTYRLSSFYFARTARAIERLVSQEETKPSATDDETQSQELKRFLDKSGKLMLWPPAKQRDKLVILEYLASFFEKGRVYHEKEVNELLLLHSAVKDSAALRRAMHEYRFMGRTRDGSQYWLIDTAMPLSPQ